MRHRTIVAAGLLVLTVVGTVAAQDYIYTNFRNGYQDHVLPVSPCDQTLEATPVFYDKTVWVFYRCATQHGGNGVVIARRYFHPNDHAVPPPTSPNQPAPSSPPNPMATILCPGYHKACTVLPAGEYPLTWADTVAR